MGFRRIQFWPDNDQYIRIWSLNYILIYSIDGVYQQLSLFTLFFHYMNKVTDQYHP